MRFFLRLLFLLFLPFFSSCPLLSLLSVFVNVSIFSPNFFDARFDCGHFNNFVSSKFLPDFPKLSCGNFDDSKISECPQSNCASKIFRENIIVEVFDTFSTLKFVGARNRQFTLTDRKFCCQNWWNPNSRYKRSIGPKDNLQ